MNEGILTASNFKFETKKYELHRMKSLSPMSYRDSGRRSLFPLKFAKKRSTGGRSCQFSARFNKVERTAQNDSSISGGDFSELVSDEG